jgi:four helix bundle protein
MPAKDVKETRLYQLAFALAMEIFEETKCFPKEEKYSLVDQIRKSSRSVCICLIEAYRKKRYPAHFILKVTESDTGKFRNFRLARLFIGV